MLILADADDVGAARLASQLAPRLNVTRWQFGMRESSISVAADTDDFEIEQPGARLSAADFRGARLVVYRRLLTEPRPLVRSDQDPADRNFSEREWGSLIDGLLLAEERRVATTWLNSPSATLATSNKLSLLLLAARAGLRVPAFTVSTPVRFPRSASGPLVTKAISTDERIDSRRLFSTAILSDADRQGLSGAHLPTPSLLQEYIEPHQELRVFYVLGAFHALALRPSPGHVDIRHVRREELSARNHELSSDLRADLARLTCSLGLNYCTFDILLPRDGPPALIDITPNGDWGFFEAEEKPLVTELIARTLVARCLEDPEFRILQDGAE